MDSKSPKIFVYSVIVPIVWFSMSFSLLAIAPEVELTVAGTIIAVNLSLFFICRHFSKRFKRQFSINEKLRLFSYSFLWITAIRGLSLYGISDDLTAEVLLYASGIVLAIDLMVISSSVFSVSNRFNRFWQSRSGKENT